MRLPMLIAAMANRAVVVNAVKVALVVGTCLNLINQGEAILQGIGIDWFRISLNYAVPYLVASYSAGKVLVKDAN
jgi:hypothetical protein